MVASAHGNAKFVKQEPHVVTVDIADKERHHAALARSGTEQADAVDCAQSLDSGREQFMLVGSDIIQAKSLHIVDGSAKGSNINKVGSACLELEGQVGKGGALKRYMAYHLSPTLIRRHLLQPIPLAIEDANASGTIHLVAREGIEIAVQVAHVHLDVGGGLGAVDVFTTPQAAMAADIVITSGSETINDATHAADDYYLDGSNITFTVNEGGVVNSISGHGDAAVSGNTVTINGGTVNHADTDWTEPSSGSGNWVGKPNLTGGFSTSGAVIGNQVSITNATLIGDYPAAYGGYSQTGNVSKNSVTFEGGDNQELYINGGFSATGVAGGDTAADGNIVTIKSGTFIFVAGGYSERGSAKNNQVSVSGGTVNAEVYGGYVGGGTGEATNNKVEISGGTVGSSVYGGYGYTGTAEGNNVNVTGGHITVSVYGGKIYGDSTNNTGAVIKNIVSVSGSGTQIDGEIYGGNSTYGKVDGLVIL